MIDLSTTPLSDQQIALLAMLGVPVYHDTETGNTYVRKRYWNGVSLNMRKALSRLATDDRAISSGEAGNE